MLLLKLRGMGGPGSARRRAERTLPVRKLISSFSGPGRWGQRGPQMRGPGVTIGTVPMPACAMRDSAGYPKALPRDGCVSPG